MTNGSCDTAFARRVCPGSIVAIDNGHSGFDGGTRIETHFRDGTLASLTGTAVFGVQYTNGFDSGQFYTQETKLNTNGALTGEWVKHFEDLAGRPVKTLYPDNAASFTYYNGMGQRTNEVDPDGVRTLYLYNDEGEVEYTEKAMGSHLNCRQLNLCSSPHVL